MVRSSSSTAVTSPKLRVRPRAEMAGAASSAAASEDSALLVLVDVLGSVMVCMVLKLRITAARS
jgi:hypothetical protein